MPVAAQQTAEFWTRDIETSANRRSLLDLAKSRFPVESKPFLQVLRSMSGTGGLDELDSVADDGEAVMLRMKSATCVYQYFGRLTAYTQVLSRKHLTPPGADSAISSLFEAKPDRTLGYVYINTRDVILPGGSKLPANSVGRLLTSNPNGPVVVSWDHQHSGWTFLLAVLQEYQKNKLNPAAGRSGRAPRTSSRQESQIETLSLEDIGLSASDVDEDLVIEILDLFRSLLHKNWELASMFANGLSNAASDDQPYTNPTQSPPDLIHVTLLILKDSLSYATSSSTRLVTSAIGLITALLPILPGRVWPFLRNLPQLFGDDRQNTTGSTPILVNQEKTLGTYQMTLSLLDLVGALFDESFRMVLTHNKALQDVKREVMLRALRFVTKEVWNEFGGWRFTRLREKFELGRKVVIIFAEILKFSPSAALPAVDKEMDGALTSDNGAALMDLTQFVLDTFLFKATGSTVNTLVTAIATGKDILAVLRKSMRAADADALVPFLEWSMRLTRLLLVRKGTMKINKVSLLEQTMFMGAVAESFVRVLEDPWEDSELRKAVWDLVAVAVDTQPAFAGLFVGGELQSSSRREGKQRADENGKEIPHTALSAAMTVISTPGLWDIAPDLLAASLGFLDLVWQHALEHLEALKTVRKSAQFWRDLAKVALKELGDPPSAIVESTITEYGETRAEQNEAVAHWAFHAMAKAHALHIFALDLKILPSTGAEKADRPDSFASIEKAFRDKESLEMHVREALRCSFNPDLHQRVQNNITQNFPSLTLDSVRSSSSSTVHQNFGDQYIFLAPVVYNRLMKYAGSDNELIYHAGEVFKGVCSINLDWSIMDAQVALARSWKELLRETAIWLKDVDRKLEETVLQCAVVASRIIADETRDGPIMVHVHTDRLALLEALLNVAWLVRKVDVAVTQSTQQFVKLVKNVRSIVGSDNFRIIDSVRKRSSVTFHRMLLYIIYFCARVGREHARNAATKLEDRLSLGSDVNDVLGHVIDALRISFDIAAAASSSENQENLLATLDQDIQLFVAVFDQCTRTELHATPSMWLARCQEAGLFKSSLELLVRTDILGRNGGSENQKRWSLSLAEHVLQFHVTLAAVPASAERLAHEGAMSAYCRNDLSPYLEAGAVDAIHSEFPGERSPYHRMWCTILGVTTSLVHVLGTHHGHFIQTEVLGFIQLYGAQLSKVLGWKVRDSLTLPLLEELDRVVGLFHGIATYSTPANTQVDPGVANILQAFSERALYLVQNVNYALTHPNHLAKLLEPITFEERTQKDKEENAMSVESSLQLIDSERRPMLSALIQKLLTLSRNNIATLLIISRSDTIFTTADRTQWPPQPVPVVAQTKVADDEPASLGTLLELGTLLSDVLKHFFKTGDKVAPNPLAHLVPSLHAFDSKNVIVLTEEALEQICLYALIQLATVVHQSYAPNPADDMSMEVQFERPPPLPPTVDPRVVREWKDLAIELNLLAKGVPQGAGGPGTRMFFDLISQSSFELVDKLDGTRAGKRMM
ncbi:hypothetical protein FRC03_010771 [Tulasnella sp. 419]|nr:hypothetical protein FRC03_010771 [Tulasnella sp. 419]